jgi:TatA/E family protein of Tat protein translocase
LAPPPAGTTTGSDGGTDSGSEPVGAAAESGGAGADAESSGVGDVDDDLVEVDGDDVTAADSGGRTGAESDNLVGAGFADGVDSVFRSAADSEDAEGAERPSSSPRASPDRGLGASRVLMSGNATENPTTDDSRALEGLAFPTDCDERQWTQLPGKGGLKVLAEIFGMDGIVVVLVIVLVLFAAPQIPKLARSLGSAKGEFEKGLTEGQKAAKESSENPDSGPKTS